MGWAFFVVCIGVLIVALWQRRWTFFATSERAALTERSMTLGLLMLLLMLLLVTPISAATIGTVLHDFTGQWYLNDWLASCCAFGFAGALVLNTQSRLDTSVDELRAWFKRRVEFPMTAAIPALLALLWFSPNADSPSPSLFYCHCGTYLALYWTVVPIFLGYLYVLAIGALLILRKEARNRRIANIYLAAAAWGLLCCAMRLITAWINIDLTDFYLAAAPAMAIAIAYASTRAWRLKIRRLNGTTARL